MTLQTQLVLRSFLEDPVKQRYGLELCGLAGLPSGTIYPILARLEQVGWVDSTWQDPAVHEEAGLPRRRFHAREGRPHSGKLHTRDAEDLVGVHTRFHEFTALRDPLDPDRRFTDPYPCRCWGNDHAPRPNGDLHIGYGVAVVVLTEEVGRSVAAAGPARAGASSARRSPGRPPVPLERIVATALQIVDEEGSDALSMRTLAQRLGSGTATLYRHFDNRAALVAHVVDRVFGVVELNGDELRAMGWERALRTVAHTMFDALARHRNAARLLVERIPLGPNAMALRERCLAVLLDSGFPPRVAAYAYATLARYVLGFAVQVNGHGNAEDPDDAQMSAVFQSVDPGLFPATVTVAGAMPVPIEEEFSFGLELLLSGLAHLRDEA